MRCRPSVEVLESRDAPSAVGPLLRSRGPPAGAALILAGTNAARAAAGVRPLVVDPLLRAAAGRRVRAEAAGNRYFGEAGFPADLRGVRGRVLGENDAFNFGYPRPARQLLRQWLGSAAHRRNITDAVFARTGVAVATSAAGITFGCQAFSGP